MKQRGMSEPFDKITVDRISYRPHSIGIHNVYMLTAKYSRVWQSCPIRLRPDVSGAKDNHVACPLLIILTTMHEHVEMTYEYCQLFGGKQSLFRYASLIRIGAPVYRPARMSVGSVQLELGVEAQRESSCQTGIPMTQANPNKRTTAHPGSQGGTSVFNKPHRIVTWSETA
ncbi:hypothetical protein GQ44DRAFT_204892 [Phaeosphaeriaceae sp. PMI808]|nr:hypothetical protein GQ44DRAFT_204892 [Phaeosphaeriaceae sp. PMI808]